jgi:hypothetical protein
VAEPTEAFAHLLVRDRAEDREFRRKGGGDPKIRPVEHRVHGPAMRRELNRTLSSLDEDRSERELAVEELKATGVMVVLEGAEATYPLRIDSLERMSRHKYDPRPLWQLLSVTAATESSPERALVWISDEYRPRFLKLFTDYVEGKTPAGNPKNRELVANIARIREAVLFDLWQSDGEPPAQGTAWWEVWLRPVDDALEKLARYSVTVGARMASRHLLLNDRTVAWLEAKWDDLQALPFSDVPVAEIRLPEFADTVEDLPREEQDELAEDLADRIRAAPENAPAVCHLDTGVRQSHVLIQPSLAEEDCHSIVAGSIEDSQNHGTPMAGLALFGSLDNGLLSGKAIELRHRLESVKMLPDTAPGHDPMSYGLATASAVSLPEASATRPRVFCMPITTSPERAGEPSLWSASIDALAAGVDIGRDDDGIALLSAPDPEASRLFVISAGNVPQEDFQQDYQAACDNAAIEDPAHAWNALTVGAYTELASVPTEPSFEDWKALAEAGDISPHSRTSLLFSARHWPLKPDICMEGGNVLTDGNHDFHPAHPLLCPRSTDAADDLAIGSANATSAATAQAARLAAMTQAAYPEYWPETVRGLLVHAAEWTPVMKAGIDAAAKREERLGLLRRYGWGTPDERVVLNSRRDAVTMVSQDQFVPFDGEDFASRRFRLHRLPWPQDILRDLGSSDVELRVTLSYFIEPVASRRGWRRRYAYPSHGLRFELKAPAESVDQFVRRVNREAQAEEDETAPRPSGAPERWLIGSQRRNHGSLHQDIWTGSGVDLADAGVLAVHPVGGWWKNKRRSDRIDAAVRYSLLVSLRTAESDVDLYTPIAMELGVPVEEIAVEV